MPAKDVLEEGFNPEDYTDEDFVGEDRLGQEIETKARRLYELRNDRDQTKATATEAEKAYRAFEAEYYAAMSNSKIKSALKLDLGDYGLVTFGLRSTTYARVLDAQKLRKWLREQKREQEFLDEEGKLSKGRLNEEVRTLLENSTPLPPGLDYTENNGVTISQQVGDAPAVEVASGDDAPDPDAV